MTAHLKGPPPPNAKTRSLQMRQSNFRQLSLASQVLLQIS